MKNRKNFFLLALTGMFLFNCANPVDDPLKWRTKVELPVTNKAFNLGEELLNLFDFDSTMDLLKVKRTYENSIKELLPDTIKGDTMVFSVLQSDTAVFENHQDSLDEKLYHATIGPIPISGANDLNAVFPIPAVAGPFSVPITIDIDSVYQIVFYDTAANVLNITLSNPSLLSSIDNVAIDVAGLGSGNVGTIPAGETRTAQIDVRGKVLNHTAVVTLSGTADGAPGNSLGVQMTLNGLLASSLSVDDHLINLTMQFENAYKLTDTLDIDYIDITVGFFEYSLTNNTDLELRMRMVHENVWIKPDMEILNINRSEDLGRADSNSFWGDMNNAETVVLPRTKQDFKALPLSATRIYPEWDPVKEESVTKVHYYATTGTPKGDTLTLSSSDSLVFSIRTLSFKFEDFEGTVMAPYNKTGDTIKIPIDIPWGDNSVRDSLRGKFVLQKVYGDVQVQTGIPEGAFIDTMMINFAWYSPDSAHLVDSANTRFDNVCKDSSFLRSLDVTRVTNLYPDSIAICTKMYIPRGSRMRVVNDLSVNDPDYNKMIGRMIIHVKTDYRLNADLDWQVNGPINMDLGSDRFAVPEELQFVRKLEDRRAQFNMYVSNNSNLNLNLFALVAPQTLIDSLNSMEANRMYSLITTEGAAEALGYVNLLGAGGLRIPPRNADAVYNSIDLSHDDLETILSSDTCGWRWMVRFAEQGRDAMSDTDFVKINSWIHVNGINNTDSLLIW
ncbi:MAG: hypothetical protein GX556_17785 [Fibrobacter sp.]|nr:hypothetical protein [Fibrobacter sp.]